MSNDFRGCGFGLGIAGELTMSCPNGGTRANDKEARGASMVEKGMMRRLLPALLGCAAASGPFFAPAVVTGGERYVVQLEEADIAQSSVIQPLSYDFDDDGIIDAVTRYDFYFDTPLRITLSSTGTTVGFGPAPGYGFNGVNVFSFNADGSSPSLVFATFKVDSSPSGFGPAKQIVYVNNGGTFTRAEIDVKVPGRDVACMRDFPGRSNPVCFFAAYWNYDAKNGPSRLVEIAPDLRVTNITRDSGLPFPETDPSGNGVFMIGAGFHDFNGDGFRDLVAVGQHGKILSALMRPDGKFSTSWFEKRDDYMRAFVPMATDLQEALMRPCAYIGTEKGQASKPDFVVCHDEEDANWYTLSLPIRSFSSHGPGMAVRFWERDGKVVFAAKAEAGSLNLFSLEPAPPPEERVVSWRNPRGVSVSGSSLQKVDPVQKWNAGASSANAIYQGFTGWVEYVIPEIAQMVVGLGTDDTGYGAGDPEIAIRLRTDGTAKAIESGTTLGPSVPYAPGDTFRVDVAGGRVKYSRNGSVFHEHDAPALQGDTLIADVSIKTVGARIQSARIAGVFGPDSQTSEPVVPTDPNTGEVIDDPPSDGAE